MTALSKKNHEWDAWNREEKVQQINVSLLLFCHPSIPALPQFKPYAKVSTNPFEVITLANVVTSA